MNRDYPGIRMHLGYYGPPLSEEPMAQMKPRLEGCEVEEPRQREEGAAPLEPVSRVRVRVDVEA